MARKSRKRKDKEEYVTLIHPYAPGFDDEGKPVRVCVLDLVENPAKLRFVMRHPEWATIYEKEFLNFFDADSRGEGTL